jgi:hypothetical protein
VKETRFRLRVLRDCDLLKREHEPIIQEATELTRILATIIRNNGG